MGKKDKRIDAYIARAPEFARPILEHLRATVHAACPDVQENLKWGMPAFEYHGLLCSMAAFKQHTTFGFWKGKLIVDSNGQDLESAMGQFGRIASMKDLPAKRVLAGYVRKAMALNEAGTTVKRVVKPKPVLRMPADFKAALAQRRAALAAFEGFSPSAQRDYLEWVLEAKQAATRAKRIATAVGWIAEGKRRNWKYEKC
jgi:uncharacterized protein YdeI (YjbR/CyaY-like superfamily)